MRICLTILFTFIFCILVLLPVFYSIKNRWSENKKNKKIETESLIEKRHLFLLDERSLQSQPMFWTVIALPLVVGAILWAFVAYQYEWEISTLAYSSLMKNAQFPFLIIALSPILGAFVMYGHRSIQTFTQISVTNKQLATASEQLKTAKEQLIAVQEKNKIDIYYVIKKNIIEELNLYVNSTFQLIITPYKIYDECYLRNRKLDRNINKDYFKSINISLIDINDKMHDLNLINNKLKLIGLSTNCSVFFNEEHLTSIVEVNGKVHRLLLSIGIIAEKFIDAHQLHSQYTNLTENINKIKGECDTSCEEDFTERLDVMSEVFSFNRLVSKCIDDLNLYTQDLGRFLYDIYSIIIPDENIEIYIPNLSSLYFGDKVAAENPNPPE